MHANKQDNYYNWYVLNQLVLCLVSLTGGNASLTDDPEHNGQGGSAYIHPDGDQHRIVAGMSLLW